MVVGGRGDGPWDVIFLLFVYLFIYLTGLVMDEKNEKKKKKKK